MKLILHTKKRLLNNLYNNLIEILYYAKKPEQVNHFYKGYAWGMCEMGIINKEEREEVGRQISSIIRDMKVYK